MSFDALKLASDLKKVDSLTADIKLLEQQTDRLQARLAELRAERHDLELRLQTLPARQRDEKTV